MPSSRLPRRCLLLLLTGLLATTVRAQDEDLTVVAKWPGYTNAPYALYHHLMEDAYALLDAREAMIERLQNAAQWKARQQEVRETLLELLGPFPERTPLNPRVVDTIEQDGFRIEKVIYESQPSFYVTAALYVPDGLEGPAPAILYASGHYEEAFRSEAYQNVVVNLVKKGFVVLAFDPIGQGERHEYVDPETNTSAFDRSTLRHSYVGAQQFITGGSLARTMIWDGIRSLDYLLTRDEVDPERIGITGQSGGGTQTAMIAAIDDRIWAAAPMTYITSFRRLWASRGPQDAEQNIFHSVARGIDHADLLEVRAPRPTLVMVTTRDIFNIQGARETVAEARRAFETLGAPDALRLSEDDAGHAVTKKNRQALYTFFQIAMGLPVDSTDLDTTPLPQADLHATETGQVATSMDDAASVFSLNRAEAEARVAKLEAAREAGEAHVAATLDAARRLSGYVTPTEAPAPVMTGRYPRDGYVVEKFFIDGEGDYPVPYLLLRPEAGGPYPAVLYLHPDGKATDAAPGGLLEKIVQSGHIVLAPDLVGMGEMGPGSLQGDSHIADVSYNQWFGALLNGRSLVGTWAGDVARLVGALVRRPDVDGSRIAVVGRAALAPVALHAAAFEPAIGRVALVEPYLSYRSLVTHMDYTPAFVPGAVAGALTAYDLPDLAASLAPRPLLLLAPTDPLGKPAAPEAVATDTAFIEARYTARDAADQLTIHTGLVSDGQLEAWLKK